MILTALMSQRIILAPLSPTARHEPIGGARTDGQIKERRERAESQG